METKEIVVIPLKDSFFCLSCEVVTNSQICPKCDKDKTIPLTWWIHSIKEQRPA